VENDCVKLLHCDRMSLKKKGCRSSLVLTEILRPSSLRKSTADLLIGPSVLTAIGWNENEAGMSAYLAFFFVTATLAADAASAEEAER